MALFLRRYKLLNYKFAWLTDEAQVSDDIVINTSHSDYSYMKRRRLFYFYAVQLSRTPGVIKMPLMIKVNAP